MSQAFHQNSPIVSFIARWIVGLLFLLAGYWKVFVFTATAHAENFFVKDFAEHWIPEWVLWGLGLGIPYLELIIGLFVCIGFRLRESLIAMGLLLIVTTYGHALHTPLFDIDGHTFTRLILIFIVLLLGWERDKSTVDFWLNKKQSQA
ncbi:DoxX family membrane protein [Alteromonadaceae bacterium M269]|nr:DoxX family membrane protein [Alteromonadaceae bacterium M269]